MITFDRERGIFHLTNAYLSCVLYLKEDELGEKELLMPYFGAPVDRPELCLERLPLREGASFDSMRQKLPYACPTEGRGDMRPPMLCAREASGQKCTELFYRGYRVEKGKPRLPGLPATYTEEESEADTLRITLSDPRTGLEAELMYTLYACRPVLACSTRLTNGGGAPLTVLRMSGVCLCLQGSWDMIHLAGAWARERGIERIPAARAVRSVSSARGASGHEHNPFIVMAAPDTGEFSGECVGVSLVWSGDHELLADENAYGSTRVLAGLNPRTLEYRLQPGEELQSPEAVCVWSSEGLSAMSDAFHSLWRERLCRGYWRDRERPVLINNWEGTYFNFDQEKLLNIARQAAEAGVELFVLDDGWFGKRDNDNCSLGDWTVDRRKLPDGLKALAEKVNALGMRFGLWFEPEMVSPDSDLYRAHPDWCLHAEGRRRSEARQQLILDMSRREVQDYVIGAVGKVLREAPIGYVKWDMNRNFKEAGSPELLDGREGEIGYRYMLGLYRVMEELTSAFPEVLFEGCSGGGGRFDPGMLHYMSQIWTSDDTDAAERLYIQHGTSLCYPVSAMGAHVSASPNHQVGRVTPMRTRGDVALAGNFGFELDPSALTEEERQEMRRQVEQVKRLRHTTFSGRFTRLLSPWEGNYTAWQFTGEDRLILCVYRMLSRPNGEPPVIRLRNVPEGNWRDGEGRVYTARDMENGGVVPRLPNGDFMSHVTVWTREE